MPDSPPSQQLPEEVTEKPIWRPGLPRLSCEQIAQVVEQQKLGATQKELAVAFNVSAQTIAKYIKRALENPAEEIPRNPDDYDSIKVDIVSTNTDLPFRDNFLWAIQTAGHKLRTGQLPKNCPNDSAFFLFRQACDDPKGFLQKFAQIESKNSENKEEKEAQKAGKRSIEEIEEQLQILNDIETELCS